MTSEVIITRPVWEEYRRIKPRLRNQALAALIDYLMTGEKPALTRNTETPFERLLLAYQQKLHIGNNSVHPSVTHPSLICHSSQEEEKQKKAGQTNRTSRTSPRPKQEAAEHSPSWGRWRGLLSPLCQGLPPSHPQRSLPPRGSERL